MLQICFTKVDRTWLFRGSKSRNKVSVGEPAEGSLLYTLLCYIDAGVVVVVVVVVVAVVQLRFD